MNKIILIGGAPTVGKSFIARKISEELRLPWVSTDGIREMMRKVVRREDFPELFHFYDKEINAKEYLTTHTPGQIVASQNKESVGVWKGVKAIIDTDYVWKNYIVEGVAVVPKLVGKIDPSKHDIKPIFLIDENEERIREVVYTRGVWDSAHTYPDDVKEVEVQWVVLFNKYIKKEAGKYGYRVYQIDNRINKRESFVDSLIKELRLWLEKG